MTTQDHYREFASRFCDTVSSGDIDAILGMYADDAHIEVMARPDLIAVKFSSNKTELREFLSASVGSGALKLITTGSMVDGDRIAVEALGATAIGSDGYVYANRYCFIMEMRNGKIWRLREYMDTLYAQEAFALLAKINEPSSK